MRTLLLIAFLVLTSSLCAQPIRPLPVPDRRIDPLGSVDVQKLQCATDTIGTDTEVKRVACDLKDLERRVRYPKGGDSAGDVVIEVLVNRFGKTARIVATSFTRPEFRDAAIEAAKTMICTPEVRNQRPVEATLCIALHFTPYRRSNSAQ